MVEVQEMSVSDIVDLCSDEEDGEIDVKPVISKESILSAAQLKELPKTDNEKLQKFDVHVRSEKSREGGSSNNIRVAQSSSRTSDQESSVADGSSSTSSSPLCAAPVGRQFWKAGNYDAEQVRKVVVPGGKNHLRVHPKFLHSNATSHKWALGAIAELLDNAVDEIQNGATFVIVDKISNPRDGSLALLVQDDGGGMDPECIRRCMSFGFSEKKSKCSIGQYGNGFKTSTMRLGADVIVFSRCMKNRILTQSVGLLSYTFLTLTGHEDIVVPMVDYEFNPSTAVFRKKLRPSEEHFASNLSTILQWSPYATETELLKQFDDIGHHGTRVVIFNLWLTDDGDMELDFNSDEEDILISGAPAIVETRFQSKMLYQQHIANRFRYSLRVYSSILYLRNLENFRIILRGRVVEHHNVARDLKFPEFILYKPQVGGNKEIAIITTIGFTKDAPHVNIHGFNVYHKNRLILPFWRVVNHQSNARGKGVVGVLEANFVEPTHDKQDFEKTSLLQKLESRLKHMTFEYWDFHCGLIGYHQVKKISPTEPLLTNRSLQPVVVNPGSPAVNPGSPLTDTSTPRASSGVFFPDARGSASRFSVGKSVVTALSAPNAQRSPSLAGGPVHSALVSQSVKRKHQDHAGEAEMMKKMANDDGNVTETVENHEKHSENNTDKFLQSMETRSLMQENQKLRSQCSEFEKMEEELQLKVKQLRIELEEVNHQYERLLMESESVQTMKVE